MALRRVRAGALTVLFVILTACAPTVTAPPAGSGAGQPASASAGSGQAAKPVEAPTGSAIRPAPAAASPAASTAVDRADLEAARKDGGVTWYTTTPLTQAQLVAQSFEAKYGIKVEVFRSGGEQVIQRFQTEASAGKVLVDLLTASDPAAFNDMIRKNQLAKFRPTNFEKVRASARNEDGFWVAQRLNLITLAFRSDKENEAEMPRKWADLADPKYKGKLVHADPAFTAVANELVAIFSRDRSWSYYESLKKNEMMIVQGHQQLAQVLATGERTIAAEAGDSDMWDLRKKGIAVKSIYPEDGVFVIPGPTAVLAGSPHPNAAKLLAEFMLSDEAQKLFPEQGYYAGRSDLPPPAGNPPLNTLKIIDVDLDYVGQNGEQIKQKFGEIFAN